MNRRPREREFPEFIAAARRFIRAAGRRAEQLEPADLPALVSLRAEVENAIAQAVAGQIGFGFSWAEVAVGLDVARQNAHKRYARYCRTGDADSPHAVEALRVGQRVPGVRA